MTAVIFDVGGVLIDWNPRHLYRKLFDGDGDDAMEWFLAQVCTPEWNCNRTRAGRSPRPSELTGRFPENADLIAAYIPGGRRWCGVHTTRPSRSSAS